MSFRQNLINARSHIVFLVALSCGLLIVTTLEDRMPTEPSQIASVSVQSPAELPSSAQSSVDPITAFADVVPLPLAVTGESLPGDLVHARTAWTYFVNNTSPETGLVNSAHNYPSTTMWETGSYFIAVISADILGLIESQEAEERLAKALATLSQIRLFDGILPNKVYNTRTGELVNYANKPIDRGVGWSALDIARVVGTLGHVERHYPQLSDDIAAIFDHWDLGQMVDDGNLIGGNMVENTLRRDQEGRVGYGQYAAKSMMRFGFDMVHAYDAEATLMVREVNGQPIPVDERLHRNITPAFTVSEPYVFDGLEFGFDARSHRFATAIYQAQELRWRETGQWTAVSESHLDEAPYFIYSTVWGGGADWAVITFQGERLDSKRTVTVKTAFAWDALFGTDYTRQLVARLAPLANLEKGWPEGLYEIDGSTNASFTANTNAVVLAALAFRAHGPLGHSGR